MLSFTRAGAVATPTTVQIRLTRRFPGRVAAGAPLPSRSLTFAELEDNLRYFTHGLRGPRTRPCTALVLSGLGLTDFEDLERALALARELGFERITAHTSAKDPALGPLARLVARYRPRQRQLSPAGQRRLLHLENQICRRRIQRPRRTAGPHAQPRGPARGSQAVFL